MILWPVRQLGRTLSDIGKAGISIDRLNEIFNEPVEDLVSGDRPEITGDIQISHGHQKDSAEAPARFLR